MVVERVILLLLHCVMAKGVFLLFLLLVSLFSLQCAIEILKVHNVLHTGVQISAYIHPSITCLKNMVKEICSSD